MWILQSVVSHGKENGKSFGIRGWKMQGLPWEWNLCVRRRMVLHWISTWFLQLPLQLHLQGPWEQSCDQSCPALAASALTGIPALELVLALNHNKAVFPLRFFQELKWNNDKRLGSIKQLNFSLIYFFFFSFKILIVSNPFKSYFQTNWKYYRTIQLIFQTIAFQFNTFFFFSFISCVRLISKLLSNQLKVLQNSTTIFFFWWK